MSSIGPPAPVAVPGGSGSVAPKADAATAAVGPESSAADAATQDATRPERTSPVNASVQRDAAEHAGDRGGGRTNDFAALLAANASDEAPTTASASTIAALPKATPDDATPETALPDQLLALLNGSWAATPVPSSQASTVSTAEPVPARTATASDAPPRAVFPGGSPQAVLPAEIGNAASSAAKSVSESGPIVLNIESANLSLDDMPAATSGSTPSYEAVAATVAAPGPMAMTPKSAALAAPLAMPADPQAGFDDGLGARIAWMAEQRVGHAEIRLNPEHIGPIEVRVQIDGVRVNAEFLSTHVEVRQAIEASVPRLREMLGQHGLQLGQADVGQRDVGRQAGQGAARNDRSASGDVVGTSGDAVLSAVPIRLRSRGLLDEYA